MLKRLLPLSFIALVLHAADAMPLLAATRSSQQRPPVERVKADVAKHGAGKKAGVTVKLRDGAKLKGYISQVGEDSFQLTDAKTGQARTLAYQDVTQVKKQGGLSLVAKVGIGLGITVGVLALLYGIGCGNDPFC